MLRADMHGCFHAALDNVVFAVYRCKAARWARDIVGKIALVPEFEESQHSAAKHEASVICSRIARDDGLQRAIENDDNDGAFKAIAAKRTSVLTARKL